MSLTTPRPWRYKAPPLWTLQKAKVLGPPHADGSDYAPLCELRLPGDAQLIVRAVNSCPACPVEVRRLYAVARELLELYKSDELEIRNLLHEQMGKLQEAVNAMQPLVTAHFVDIDHAVSRNKAECR